MSQVIYRQIQNGVQRRLDTMLAGATKLDAIINRYVLPMYQEAQVARWESENQSEGQRWKSLSPRYLAWKRSAGEVRGRPILRGGDSILVLTGDLVQAAVLKNKYGTKLVEKGILKITITLPYASYVNETRNFTQFGQTTRDKMKNMVREAIRGGIKAS